MSQSIHDQEDSLDEKILRDFHFHPPTINEEVHGELPKISNKAKIENDILSLRSLRDTLSD